MESLRRAALAIAVIFPGTHLFLLLTVVPSLFGPAPPGEGEGGRFLAIALLLGLGALGGLAVWLPIRALERATRARGAMLLGWGGLYLLLILPALLVAPAGEMPGPGWIAGLSLWLHVPLTVLLILTLGLIRETAVPAGLYVAVLLIGALLTIRAARAVDGRGRGR